MNSSALVGLALIACLACSCGKKPAVAPPPIVWHNLVSGEALARREHKPAVVYVTAEWSLADKMLDDQTFPDPEVRAAMRPFVAIRVDMTDDDNPEAIKACHRFKCLGVPTILAMRSFEAYPAGELFRSQEYMEPSKLAARLREAAAKAP